MYHVHALPIEGEKMLDSWSYSIYFILFYLSRRGLSVAPAGRSLEQIGLDFTEIHSSVSAS